MRGTGCLFADDTGDGSGVAYAVGSVEPDVSTETFICDDGYGVPAETFTCDGGYGVPAKGNARTDGTTDDDPGAD